MLVAAALVPETALLVPGAGGRSDPLTAEREAALAAVRTVLAAAPDRVVLVVGGLPVAHGGGPGRAAAVEGGLVDGARRPVLEGAGIPGRLLEPSVGSPGAPGPVRVLAAEGIAGPPASVATAVGLLLLTASGWTGEVEVVGAAGEDAPALRSAGRDLVRGGRVGLVLVGSLSARSGREAPLPHDARAPEIDDAAARALTALDAVGRDWLAAVPATLARELAVSAWGPWQVLLGALDLPGVPGGSGVAGGAGGEPSAPHGTLHSRTSPFGATYAVLSWALHREDRR